MTEGPRNAAGEAGERLPRNTRGEQITELFSTERLFDDKGNESLSRRFYCDKRKRRRARNKNLGTLGNKRNHLYNEDSYINQHSTLVCLLSTGAKSRLIRP